MAELFLRLRDQVLLIWQRLNQQQRIALGVGAGALVVVLALVLRLSVREDFGTLFSGLEEPDAAAIVAILEEQGIPFEITDGGRTIRVPVEQVLEERLKLAAQGVPSRGTVGFEIFDEVSFTITDLTQRVNFRRALEGELVRTITSLDAVGAARVHLVLPEPALFTEQQAPTTASVVLSLLPAKRLTVEQVAGIRNLVSSSVENLRPEGVTIVDSSGTALTADLESREVFGAGRSANQLEVQRSFENQLRGDIQRFVATVVGPNKATVNVRAELNWDSSETVTETFNPTQGAAGIPRSQQQITETFKGPPAEVPGGVPGVTANLPGTPQGATVTPTTGTGQSEYARNESITNFDISKSESKVVAAAGTIKRLAVSLFVDESVPEAAVASIQTGVSALMNQERGDAVSVQRLAFDTTLAEEAQRQLAAAEQQARITQLLTLVVVVVIVLAVLFFLFRLTRAIRRAVVPPPPAPEVQVPALAAEELRRLGLPEGLPPEEARALLVEELRRRGEEAALPAGEAALPEGEEALPEGEEAPPPDLEGAELERMLKERERTRSRLMNIARERPEEVVRLLETWLAQD